MKLNIGIDARTIFSLQPRGIGKTSTELYIRLTKIMPQTNFFFYFEPIGVKNSLPSYPNIYLRTIDIRGARWNLWENLRLPLAALKDRIQILHCPAQIAPYWKPVTTIVTIHDLIPLKIDDGFSALEKKNFERNVRNSIRNATHVITVSEFSKQDILNLFPEIEEKITVIYWAPPEKYRSINSETAHEILKKNYNLEHPFFFSFGGSTPRKNVDRLIKAFIKFQSKCNNSVKLVISGVNSEAFNRFESLITSFGLQEKIVNIGFVPEEHIPLFLSGAIALIYASLYEGFGLPILEAFTCHCPVITSNRTSMPEIAGNAAIFINPESIDDIFEAMKIVYENPSVREELIFKGKKRLENFSWNYTMEGFAQVFESVAIKKGLLY